MTKYLVVWEMEFDADSAEDAARQALKLHRDPASIATVFTVAPCCACGVYHDMDCEQIDLAEPPNVKH